ncbi:MAG: patatin-like phospholipase family protein [Oscillospiraceae bacterium]|jgi:predicted patatin/cPLA2 family phospholipase
MTPNGALVLEGGSMRCLFTAGVLDLFLERELYFPYVIGVSAGSLSGLNYVSKQAFRTAGINIRFANDRRYLGVRNFLRTGSIFNFDMIFGEISQTLMPFDYQTFESSTQRYIAVATDCKTGEATFHEKGVSEDIYKGARASSSIPLLAPVVQADGFSCLDGGVAMPIPYEKAMADGYEKIVVVLTRDKNHRKPPASPMVRNLYHRAFRSYPAFVDRLERVPEQYNQLQEEMDRLEAEGRIFLIRPEEPVKVKRTERDTDKLKELYAIGQSIGAARWDDMMRYLEIK